MKKYRTKSGKVEEKLQGVNATVNPSEKAQIAMAGGADTLKDVQTILGQEGKRNNLKGQGAKHLVSFAFSEGPDDYGYDGTSNIGGLDVSGGMAESVMGPPTGHDYTGEGDWDPGPPGPPTGMSAGDSWNVKGRRAVHKSDKPPGPSAWSLDRSMRQLHAAGKLHAATQQQYEIMNPKGKAIGGPGDRTGMGVYGSVDGSLTFLGTEGFGRRDSLGDISQWSPSDYVRTSRSGSSKPTESPSLQEARDKYGHLTSSPQQLPEPTKSSREKNLALAKEDASFSLSEMAGIHTQLKEEKGVSGMFNRIARALTESWDLENLSKVNLIKGGISLAGGPLGAMFVAGMGRGVNEPPESPSVAPVSKDLVTKGKLGPPSEYGFPTAKRHDQPGDFPGYANVKAPPEYSTTPKGGDSSESPTPKVVRAASNNVTLNIPEEDDLTREEIRTAQRQITRFA
jgi:hypothetical protein